MENDIAGAQVVVPKKSGSKKWIFLGCGFLGILGLGCAGVFGYFGYVAVMPMYNFMTDNMALLESSEQVKEAFGDDVTFGTPTQSQGGPEGRTIEWVMDAQGSKGSGQVGFVGEMQSDFSVERKEMYLIKGGQRVPIDPDSELNFSIEGL